MPGDFDLNSIEERILQFVKDNPGKSKSDVVRFLKDRHIAARIATLAHIDRLESRRMIICQLENPNSQIYKIYINKDNQLSAIIIELEEFKEAYVNLLEKSKEMINNKNYSSKALGVTEPDPIKWSESDRRRYSNFEYDKLVKFNEIASKSLTLHRELRKIMENNIIDLIKRHRDEIEKEVMQTMKEKSQEPQRLNRVSKIIKEAKTTVTQYLNELSQNLEEQITVFKVQKDIAKSLTGEIYHMAFGPVILFYTMTDTIFYRSMRWSSFETGTNKEDRDEEFLPQLYSIVYRKISEIQLELSRFLRSIKFESDFNNIMVKGRTNKVLFGLGTLVGLYYDVNMKSEIQQVIYSLTKLNEEIKDLNVLRLDDRSSDKRYSDIIKTIEDSRNIKENLARIMESYEGIEIDIENRLNSLKNTTDADTTAR
jgi:hypothetical protein